MTARYKMDNYIGETPEQLNARTQIRLREMQDDAAMERLQYEAPYKYPTNVAGANRRALYGASAPTIGGSKSAGAADFGGGAESRALAKAAMQGAALGAGSSYNAGAGAPSPVTVMRGMTQTYQAPIEGAWGTETATEQQARQLYNQQALKAATAGRAQTGAKLDFPQYGRYISTEEEKAMVTGQQELQRAQAQKALSDARTFDAAQDVQLKDRMQQHILKNMGNEHFDMELVDGKKVPKMKPYVQNAIIQAMADMQPGENEGVTMKRLGDYLKQSSIVHVMQSTDPEKIKTLLAEFEKTPEGSNFARSIATLRGRNGVWDRTDSPLAEALEKYNKTRTVGKENEKRPLSLSDMPQTIGFADADIPDYRMEAPNWLQRSTWALERPVDYLQSLLQETDALGTLRRGMNLDENSGW